MSTRKRNKRAKKEKAKWVPDDYRESCGLCTSQFNCCRRRHHCRACGELVCAVCSARTFALIAYDKSPVRICDDCFSPLKEHTLVTGEYHDENMDYSVTPIEVADVPVPLWEPKESNTACSSCNAVFTSLRWRCHCRLCGKAYCGSCCSQALVVRGLGQDPVPVCLSCAEKKDVSDAEATPEPTEESSESVAAGAVVI
jgi:hypothetical protein